MDTLIFKSTRIFQRIIAPLALMVALLLPACTSDPQTEALLQRASSMMEPHPDSAYHILDSIAPYMVEKPERLRMRHLMLSAQAQNKLIIPFTTDSVMKAVSEYYDLHGNANDRMLAHYLLGCTYRDMNDYPTALNSLYGALSCADTLDTECNHTYMANIYIQMYEIFYKQSMPTKALEVLTQAHRQAKLSGDRYRANLCTFFMIRTYNMLGDTVRMLEKAAEARRFFREEGRHKDAVRTYNADILVAVNRGEYDRARKMMDIYEKESGLFDGKGNIQKGFEKYYYIKGFYYLGVDNLDSAETCFRNLARSGYVLDTQKAMLELYKRKKETDSIIKYASLFEQSLTAWMSGVKSEKISRIVASNDYSRYKKKAITMEEEINESHTLSTLLLVSLVFTFIISLMAVGLYRWRKKTEIRQVEEKYRHLIKEKDQIAMELERIKIEISQNDTIISVLSSIISIISDRENLSDEKNDKLKLPINEIENTRMAQKEIVQAKEEEIRNLHHLISDYEKKLSILQGKKEKISIEMILLRFKNKAKNKKGAVITESDWEEFSDAALERFPGLASTVGDNGLTKQEKKTILLVLFGMSNKEICNILDTSPQNVTNWKSSANKKLFSDVSAATLENNLKRIL